MKRLSQILILASLITHFSCGQKNKEQSNTEPIAKIEKYVSITCPTGDITLTLNPDSTFDVTILYWDTLSQKQTGQANIQGKWYKKDSVLNLINKDGLETDYHLTTIKMQIGTKKVEVMAYKPFASDKENFYSHYELLDQKETDKFLLQSTK